MSSKNDLHRPPAAGEKTLGHPWETARKTVQFCGLLRRTSKGRTNPDGFFSHSTPPHPPLNRFLSRVVALAFGKVPVSGLPSLVPAAEFLLVVTVMGSTCLYSANLLC